MLFFYNLVVLKSYCFHYYNSIKIQNSKNFNYLKPITSKLRFVIFLYFVFNSSKRTSIYTIQEESLCVKTSANP